jgi:hypothetical protein
VISLLLCSLGIAWITIVVLKHRVGRGYTARGLARMSAHQACPRFRRMTQLIFERPCGSNRRVNRHVGQVSQRLD